ncbi:MAG: universal stress protein [Alphaproteobacteria bacterium]|nr:universal stress protein [Alphaproteobacteria bacterium]MBV9150721.1 universal stress protein [Alphaproteobacteria bacterium]
METRDILVVIENASVVPQRVQPAAALATRFGARLTGFYASGYPIMASYGEVSGWGQLVDTYLDAQRQEAARAGAAFREALTRDKLPGEWIFREADETSSVIAEASLYDLVVIGQPNPEAGLTGAIGLRPEEIVLGCGRPVLVVPYAGEFADLGRHVLVAWSGSREAARALHDAQFLLAGAATVTVMEIDPPAPGVAAPAASAAQVAAALSRRGIAAKPESETTSGEIDVEDLLLSRASDLGADLLVMGAYGHSRLREFVLGGVSRGIFRHMTLPVLMAH